MRKTLAVLALVAALSSCGSGKGETSALEAEVDTTATEVTVDSTAAAVVDSAVVE
jgi:hypothetical protein